MKNNMITIKNELPELLEAVCEHTDCPEWLRNAVWDAFNDQYTLASYKASHWRNALESITKEHLFGDTENETISPADDSTIAEHLSRVLADERLPEPLREGIQEAIVVTFNGHINQDEIADFEASADYIDMVIRGYHKRQSAGGEA